MANPNMSTNHNAFHSQSHPQNQQFPSIPNQYQLPLQNFQMGLPQPQFFPQNLNYNPMCQPQGQFFANNHPQVMNMPGGQFNFHHLPQHLNRIPGLPPGRFPQHHIGFPQVNPFNVSLPLHPAMGYVNQGAQQPGSQNIGFQMNPQSGIMNSQPVGQNAQSGIMNSKPVGQNAQSQNALMPSAVGQNAPLKSPIASQQLQRNPLSSVNNGQNQMQQTQNNLPSNNFGIPQGNHANYNVSNMSNTNQWNPQGNFTRNPQDSARNDSRSMRFQKFNVQPNAKVNFKSFKGKGSNDKGARNPQLPKRAKQEPIIETKRRLPLNYTAQEIKKWRDDRKRHHPSRPKIDKISDGKYNGVVNDEVKKRRQQLKEILAKQAELGVEVAEIPQEYLLDSEKQVNEKGQKGRLKKRGWGRQQRRRQNKKQKTGDNEPKPKPKPDPTLIKRSETLLQKLHGGDIKRDKSHLLQAFRLMVLNNFFLDFPKKPLEIPSVIVKGEEIDKDMVEPVDPVNEKDVEDGEDEDENSEEEEGELTD